MAKRQNPDPYAVDLPEIRGGGSIDFDAGLPPTGRTRRAKRSKVSKRHEVAEDRLARSYDPGAELGEGHARGNAGERYRDEGLDFDSGLPSHVEKADGPVEATGGRHYPPPPPVDDPVEDNREDPVDENPDAILDKALHLVKAEGTRVQTLILSKTRFKNAEAAKAWAKANKFRADKVDETDKAFRLRQAEPSDFVDGSFRTIQLSNGVQAVIGKPKGKTAAKKQDRAPEGGHAIGMLSWTAVRKGALQVDEDDRIVSGLPESLEKDVPPAYRFWKCETREEALRVREALVETGLFAPENIREVNGELRRAVAEKVIKLYLPPEYNEADPVVVPPERRPVEKAAALLEDAARIATLFDEAITEAMGLDTILEKVEHLAGDWVICAKDTAENRKAFGRPVFRLMSRDDLIFGTNADLADPDSVEWVVHSRADEVIKFAFAEGRKIPLLKAEDGEERIVFGVVLEPDEVDSQNDTIDAETIRTAAHKFMEDFGNLGLQHKEIVNGRLKLLENFIAPVAFKVDGEKVKPGTWLMKQRVVDDELWAAVKAGKFTGFSIGGSAIRKPSGKPNS